MHGSLKRGTKYDLLNRKVDIEDVSYRSKYFTVSDLNESFSAGKNLFSINGSELLKPRTNIILEILDSENNPLYYEIGKSGYASYLDTTDLVLSVHVYESTPAGFGKVVLLGTTKDNKTVRWSTNIKINPLTDNSSKVIFLKEPTIEFTEFLSLILNEDISSNSQIINTISGTILSSAIVPESYSDLDSFDFKKIDVDYRIKYENSSAVLPSDLFSSQNNRNSIILYVNKIAYLDGAIQKTASVDITESFVVSDVVNNYELKLDRPFVYNIKGVNQVVPILSATFEQTFNSSIYITSSTLISSSGFRPDGDEDPNIFFSRQIGDEVVFLKEPFLDVVYKNLKTLSGKVHRHKVYRRGLNKASDFECISDEPLIETELFSDTSTVNRFFNKLGEFYNLQHINRYYYTSSADLSLSHSSVDILNSMICNVDSINEDQSRYIILKNDSSLVTISQSKSSYVNYNQSSDLVKTGSSYDSNFIQLYKNADYLFSSNVDITKSDPSSESKLIFYLTGSYNSTSSRSEQNYVDGKGLKLHEYVLPVGVEFKKFKKDDFTFLNFLNDYIGTLVIIPVNISNFRISKLSMISHAEFGFSPDVFVSRIPFSVSIKNEQYEVKSEFLDVNNNSIYSSISRIINVDKHGQTLFKNIANYLVSDSSTIQNIVSSGSITLSASRTPGTGENDFVASGNRACLSVIESFAVQERNILDPSPFFIVENGAVGIGTYVKISGSLNITGSINMSGSVSLLVGTSSYALNSSSSSYALNSSKSVSSSYLNYTSAGSLQPNSVYFTASAFPESARSSSGYIKAELAGVGTIYIPYYTSI